MKITYTGFLFLTLIIAASAVEGGAPGAEKAKQISCHAAYRYGINVPIEHQEQMSFADAEARQALAFKDLILNGQYWTGKADRQRSLRLSAATADKKRELISQLYQLPLKKGPRNQFEGGHGFTGLTYVVHPASGAELQFWCEAQ